MSEHTDRPNGNDATGAGRGDSLHSVAALFAFFERWLSDLEKFYNERDRRYEDRFAAQEKAVSFALAAADKQVTTAFSASEKAVLKSEEAQREYNIRSNEFRGQLDDQAKTLMPRTEALARYDGQDTRIEEMKKRYDAEIGSLRESRAGGSGAHDQQREGRQQSNWLIGILIGAIPTALLLGDLLFRKP